MPFCFLGGIIHWVNYKPKIIQTYDKFDGCLKLYKICINT